MESGIASSFLQYLNKKTWPFYCYSTFAGNPRFSTQNTRRLQKCRITVVASAHTHRQFEEQTCNSLTSTTAITVRNYPPPPNSFLVFTRNLRLFRISSHDLKKKCCTVSCKTLTETLLLTMGIWFRPPIQQSRCNIQVFTLTTYTTNYKNVYAY